MKTAEEKIEVAENLRKQLRYMRKNNSYDEDVNVVACGNSAYRNIAGSVESYGNFEKGNYVHIIERLADLIDPTCHNKADELNRMAPLEMRTDNLICSACGETFCADEEGVNHPIDWAYCPNCGARVTTGGERPDSWERLEDDARQLDIDLNDTTDEYPRMSCCRDLVRRAKALADKEER